MFFHLRWGFPKFSSHSVFSLLNLFNPNHLFMYIDDLFYLEPPPMTHVYSQCVALSLLCTSSLCCHVRLPLDFPLCQQKLYLASQLITQPVTHLPLFRSMHCFLLSIAPKQKPHTACVVQPRVCSKSHQTIKYNWQLGSCKFFVLAKSGSMTCLA